MLRPIYTLLILLSVTLFGCGEKEISLPGLTDSGALVILYSPDDKVLDHVRINKGTDIIAIEFIPDETYPSIKVACIGPALGEPSLTNMTIGTTYNKAYEAQIRVEVENDMVQAVFGNSMSSTYPITLEHLTTIKAKIDSGAHKHLPITHVIKQDPNEANLVTDADGNRVPSDITDVEKAFVESFTRLIKAPSPVSFDTHIHGRKGDRFGIKNMVGFLEQTKQHGVSSITLKRLTLDHPNNKEHLVDTFSGKPIEFSAEPRWLFTVHSANNMQSNCVLGLVDDEIKVLVRYAAKDTAE